MSKEEILLKIYKRSLSDTACIKLLPTTMFVKAEVEEAMDIYSKQLTDEIEQQKMQCLVYHNDTLNLEGEKVGLIDEIEKWKGIAYVHSTNNDLQAEKIQKLQSDLKAADSVNEKLSRELYLIKHPF